MSSTYGNAYQSGGGSNAVWLGFWHDHDRGMFLGPTLTLRDRDSTVLLAALTVLVSLAAGRSWHIWRTLGHILLGRSESEPSLEARKKQVILRNSETPAGAFFGLIGDWFESSYKKMLLRRTASDYILSTFALGHVCAFIAAGLLVSQVVVGKVVVSKVTPTCGQWQPITPEYEAAKLDTLHWKVVQEFQVNATIDAENYVRSCYNRGSSQAVLDCNKFITRSIPVHIEHRVDCPFTDDICVKSRGESAFAVDTGNFSLSQLGLNMRYGKQITFRRRSHCAVVDVNRFEVPQDPADVSNNTIVQFFDYSFYRINNKNETFWFPLHGIVTGWDLFSIPIPAQVDTYVHPKDPAANDVSLLLLQGRLFFAETSDDPWFSVHHPSSNFEGFYEMDDYLNMVACTEQKQYCSSITGTCSPWMGILTLATNYTTPAEIVRTLLGPGSEKAMDSTNIDQLITSINFIETIVKETGLARTIQFRRPEAVLQAATYILGGRQTYLHPEQWKVELTRWFATALARIQLGIIDSIEPSPHLDLERMKNTWEPKDNTTGLMELCGRVKFRDPYHTSLSTLGIAIVFAIVGALALASFGVSIWQQLGSRDFRAIAQWRKDEVLSLLDATEDIPAVPSTFIVEGKY